MRPRDSGLSVGLYELHSAKPGGTRAPGLLNCIALGSLSLGMSLGTSLGIAQALLGAMAMAMR
jgi:hypothetical protein